MAKVLKVKYGNFIILSTITTDIVKEACSIHRTNPPASAALGRALTGLILLSNAFNYTNVKRLVMQFITSGEISEIAIETDMKQNYRAFIRNPNPRYEIRNKKLPVGDVVGKGLIYFYRYFENEIYQSISEIVSGEIAEDIAYFLYNSEQIPCAISLGVLVDMDGSIKNSGGIFIYAKPGTDESELMDMEKRIKSMGPITELIEEDKDEYDLISNITKSWNFINEAYAYHKCWCSEDSIKDAILSIPKEEMLKEFELSNKIEVVCRYCRKSYLFNKFQILKIYKDLTA